MSPRSIEEDSQLGDYLGAAAQPVSPSGTCGRKIGVSEDDLLQDRMSYAVKDDLRLIHRSVRTMYVAGYYD
jgi:hypothetical protein